MADENPLTAYAALNEGRLLYKWEHYFDLYDRYLRQYRGTDVVMVEVGVFHGGSLDMWKHYLGPRARIFGVDIDPRCTRFADEQVEILIGDQADRGFLRELREHVGTADVVLDDGGHRMDQQIATLEGLFPAVRDGGTYLTEDLHTSYWDEYDGGLLRPGSFIDYAKGLVDRLHAWHAHDDGFVVDDWTRTLRGVHFHDSVVVLEKGPVPRPRNARSGSPVFEGDEAMTRAADAQAPED